LNAIHRPEPVALIEPMLSIADVCRALSCCRRTVEHLRAAGRFPKPDCHVGRCPKWKRTTLEAWIAEGGSR